MSIKKAGPITGDPVKGLCFRECIEVSKVFDGCISRFVDVSLSADIPPEAAPLPFTYLDAHTNGEPSIIRNIKIHYLDSSFDIDRRIEIAQQIRQERANNRCCYANQRPLSQLKPRPARVDFDTIIPVEIDFEDAAGGAHHAHSYVTMHRRVKLLLPPESLTPFEIKTNCTLASSIGSFTTPTHADFNACIVQIVKVTETVDMLVPSYGYCNYPDCEDNENCGDINQLPIFPPFA